MPRYASSATTISHKRISFTYSMLPRFGLLDVLGSYAKQLNCLSKPLGPYTFDEAVHMVSADYSSTERRMLPRYVSALWLATDCTNGIEPCCYVFHQKQMQA